MNIHHPSPRRYEYTYARDRRSLAAMYLYWNNCHFKLLFWLVACLTLNPTPSRPSTVTLVYAIIKKKNITPPLDGPLVFIPGDVAQSVEKVRMKILNAARQLSGAETLK